MTGSLGNVCQTAAVRRGQKEKGTLGSKLAFHYYFLPLWCLPETGVHLARGSLFIALNDKGGSYIMVKLVCGNVV